MNMEIRGTERVYLSDTADKDSPEGNVKPPEDPADSFCSSVLSTEKKRKTSAVIMFLSLPDVFLSVIQNERSLERVTLCQDLIWIHQKLPNCRVTYVSALRTARPFASGVKSAEHVCSHLTASSSTTKLKYFTFHGSLSVYCYILTM